MSQQLSKPKCARCFHEEYNHQGVCNGDLTCMCTMYVPPVLYEFAQRIEEEKHLRKAMFGRIKWLLEQVPHMRNAGEKTFYKIYIEVYYGVKIRKNTGISLTKEVWDRIPNQDSVSREHRRVTDSKHFPELDSYSKEVLWHQTAIYEALMEMAIDG